MNLVLTHPLTTISQPEVYVKPEGILNSNYKAVAKENFNRKNSNSIFGIRQRIKSSQLNHVNLISGILKISVFGAILVAVF